MARKASRGAGSSEPNENDGPDNGKSSLGRRALLTRGGVVAAGVVGAGAVATAVAGPASAQATTAVDMNTVNDAGTFPTSGTPTELDADNNTMPAFIVTNTGIDNETPEGSTTEYAFSGPNLRLTPSPGSSSSSIPNAYAPTPSTVGGDLTATADGDLWFTHDFALDSPPEIFPARVLTEAIGNAYAQLEAAVRILDTRSASGRANIVNPSGNLNSAGQLKAGKTIYINLDTQVFYSEAVFANVTVTDPTAAGFLTIWSGLPIAPPLASAIDFAKDQTLCNFVASGVAEYSTTITNVIAIYAGIATTHVILDLAGFTVPNLAYAKFAQGSANRARNARLQRAQQAMRNAMRKEMRKDRRA
jgi:hypothetical protein